MMLEAMRAISSRRRRAAATPRGASFLGSRLDAEAEVKGERRLRR